MLFPQVAAMVNLRVKIVADGEAERLETVELRLLNAAEVSNRGEFPQEEALAPRIETRYTVDSSRSTYRLSIGDP